MNKSILLFSVLLIIFIIVGCSGSTNSPVSPGFTQNFQTQHTSYSTNKVLWGYWNVTIDGKSNEVNVLPLRNVEFTCNVTRFLQPPASPINMLTINILPGSNPPAGYFNIKVGVSNPFPSIPFFRGFDVRGIFLTDGAIYGLHDPTVFYPDDSGTRLLNPDGYTRWWNPSEFTTYETIFGYTQGSMAPPIHPTATLNGYKYFADGFAEDASMTDLDPAMRGTFANDSGINSRDYEIQFKQNGGQNVFNFVYAIDASWFPPDEIYAPDYPIDGYTTSAQCGEAYWINADFTGSTAFFQTTVTGGDIHCALEIGDWAALDDGVDVEDEISAIWVESYELFPSPIDVLPLCSIADGNGVSTSIFTFDLFDVTPQGIENQMMMVTVESSDPSSYKPQIEAGDLFAYPSSPLAAFMMFEVPIVGEIPTKQPQIDGIVPSQGVIDTGDLPVTISGENFEMDATVMIANVSPPGNVIDGQGVIVDPTGTTIDCTFDMDSIDGAVLGLYDVVVTNPGPPPLFDVLFSGFEIIEEIICDTVYSNEIYSGNLVNHAEQVHAVAMTKDNMLISRVSDSGYSLYAFDVTQNGNVVGTPVVVDGLYLEYSLGDIDICDVTENIIYAICGGGYEGLPIRSFVAYTKDGELIGEYESPNCDHLQGIDTDDDGSLWVVGHSYIDPPNSYLPEFVYVEHWLWDDVNGEYVYDPSGFAEITQYQMYNGWADIYSTTISYTEDLLCIYSPGVSPYKGQIDFYDISTGVPVWSHKATDLLSSGQGGHAFYNWRTAEDIEIDHSDPNKESCRLMLSSRLWWQYGEEFVKIDTDGNVIDRWTNVDADDEGGMYWCHGYSQDPNDPDGIFLVAMEDNVHT